MYKKLLKSKKKLTIPLLIMIFITSFWSLIQENHYKEIQTIDQLPKYKGYTAQTVNVVGIYDGDTITITTFKQPKKKVQVRMKGLDCFEVQSNFPPVAARAKKQARHFNISVERVYELGSEARSLLRKKIRANRNQVTLVYKKNNNKDYYKRLLAYVFIDKENVNTQLIESQTCFTYIRNL